MAQTSGTTRIKVADDEPVIAYIFIVILRYRGYDAYGARCAEETLPWCLSNRPDVVFTDVVMGGPMNGIQLSLGNRAILFARLIFICAKFFIFA